MSSSKLEINYSKPENTSRLQVFEEL